VLKLDRNGASVHQPSAAKVRIEGLTVRFSQFTALSDISLDIADGEFVCLIGPSGCGKTTLLNTMAGFEAASEGTLYVRGRPVSQPGPDRGVVFQEYGLFPWFTVEKNVQYGPCLKGSSRRELQKISDHYLSLVHLEHIAKHFPSQLSGGMRQRVAIARALANKPDILLMDEPFGALDAMTREILQDELLNIWELERRTCVFVRHSIGEAIFLADRTLSWLPIPVVSRVSFATRWGARAIARRAIISRPSGFSTRSCERKSQLPGEPGGRRMICNLPDPILAAKRKAKKLDAVLAAVAIAGCLLLWWWLVSATGPINRVLLPTPDDVLIALDQSVRDGTIWINTWASLLRVGEGFLLGFSLAVPLGVLMGNSRIVRGLIEPLIELVRPIPPIAMIPIMILWFGIGELSKVLIIANGAFFLPILEPVLIGAARTLGAGRWQIFRDAVLRSALPSIIVGARLGMGLAFIVLVAAELIASSEGLGFLINDGRYNFRADRVFLGMLLIGVLGFILNKTLIEIERRLLCWRTAT
jgi:ABC-type nitrate/sulfonate/bicarbonate transport system ATPase subunit/ABC-type nitrate/sulfonate/bicarbonate transport system permease component